MKITKTMIKAFNIVGTTDYTYFTFEVSGSKNIKRLLPALKVLINNGYIYRKGDNLIIKKQLTYN